MPAGPGRSSAKLDLAALLALCLLIRLTTAYLVGDDAGPELRLFARPWHRPPLLDLLTLLCFGSRTGLATALSLATVAGTWALARRHLDRGGALLAGGLALIAPPLVWLGTWWGHAGVTTAATVGTALILTDLLDGRLPPRRGAALLGVAVFLLIATDWPAWAPALAWLGWVLAFPPETLGPDRLRPAAIGLVGGVLVALPVYVALSLAGADPVQALRASELPLGVEALYTVLDALAGLLLARPGGLALPLRVLVAGLVVALGVAAASRSRARAPASEHRVGVLLVGAFGAFAPALAMQPWIPVAVDKHVWYGAPLLCVLIATAIRPPAPPERTGQAGDGAHSLPAC